MNLEDVPGRRRVGRDIRVPPDCAWIGAPAWTPGQTGMPDFTPAMVEDRARVRGPLRTIQREDAAFVLQRGGGMICHPTSGGKTLTALAAASARGGNVLIIGPALSRQVWIHEVEKWFDPHVFQISQLRGRTVDRAALDEARTGSARTRAVYVNHEVIQHWSAALKQRVWDTVIFDEIHDLRNGRKARSKAANESLLVSGQATCIGLTATPIWKGVMDLYQQLNLIHPGWYGSYTAFAKRYAGAVENIRFGGLTLRDVSHADELRRRLEHVIRRIPKEEILPDLPPLRRRRVVVENAAAAKRMQRAAENLASMVDSMSKSQVESALAQAVRRETPVKAKKLPEVIQRMDARRVLVFTETVDAVGVAGAALEKAGIEWTGFSGKDPLKKRMETLEEAGRRGENVTRPDHPFYKQAVVCTGPSALQSINASMMDGIVFLEFPWTGAACLQQEGRVHRKDQARSIPVVYMAIDNSLDSRVIDRIVNRLDQQEAVLGLDMGDAGLRTSMLVCDEEYEILRRLGIR